MADAPATPRLEGLDIARYLAFVGMVLVNFKIVMGADQAPGLAGALIGLLEGRAAATFVVLAGVGLALAARFSKGNPLSTTMKRAAFLLVIGLANMLIFEADIIHYYAFYYLFGVFFLNASLRVLILSILGLNLLFLGMLFILNYDAGWDWDNVAYVGFWTPNGFIRNLFFNGWHPVIPWLSFLLFGIALSRFELGKTLVQRNLILGGAAAMLVAEGLRAFLTPTLTAIDPELGVLVGTSPIPPMPLYILAGCGVASLAIGLCLRLAPLLNRFGLMALIAPAGRHTLTLYMAHILVGMGILEALGLLGGQTGLTALVAGLAFCAGATLFSVLWSRVFPRGPLETVMRRVAG